MAEELLQRGTARIRLPLSATEKLEELAGFAKRFFAQPVEMKELAIMPDQCGYRPMGIEYSVSAERPDLIESFTYSPRANESAKRLHGASAELWHAMHWPFQYTTTLANQTFYALSDAYSSGLSEMDTVDRFSAWSRLQINFSRPSQNVETPIHESHEDGDFFTIATASGAGLQVESLDGMIEGPASFQSVLFMPGKILHLISGGDILPAYHHVISREEIEERVALMLFADLDPRHCKPWRTTEINEGIDIGQMVVNSTEQFGLNGFSEN